MKISEIMSVNSIVLSLKANNKRQLLQALAEKAAEITGISERTIFAVSYTHLTLPTILRV